MSGIQTSTPTDRTAWEVINGELKPVVYKATGEVIYPVWMPQAGSQTKFLMTSQLQDPDNPDFIKPIYEVLYEGNRGPGKALPIDTPISTNKGWSTHGALIPGDYVYGSDGNITKVLSTHDRPSRECYKVLFDDGVEIIADGEHLWNYKCVGQRGWDRVDNTLRIKELLDKNKRPLIPTCDAIEHEHAELPIDPYILGSSLGDGSNNKHIPYEYMNASKEQRLAILQGLLDTDGSVCKKGYIEYTSASKMLAEGVQQLVNSLGGKASIKPRPTYMYNQWHENKYKVYIQHGNKFTPFRLKRKADRIQPYMHDRLSRRIISIKPAGIYDCNCISVQADNNLYLAGHNFIVTHNTDSLLMDFLQDVGKGWGPEWRGLIFRTRHKDLEDLEVKSRKWFPSIFPGCKYNQVKKQWTFPEGETLQFTHAMHHKDYMGKHGQSFTWLGFEELTSWKTDELYLAMFSVNRSSIPGMPVRIRSTTNPYGVGVNWVKERFRLSGVTDKICWEYIEEVHEERGIKLMPRMAIHSHLLENKILLHAQPNYISTILTGATDQKIAQAWIDGNWDAVTGDMFGDIWMAKRQYMIKKIFQIPHSWRVDRSFDWGISSPYAVCWWAESDGSDYIDHEGKRVCTVRGDLFLIHELYGWGGKPNKGTSETPQAVAQTIKNIEANMPYRVNAGVSDNNITNPESNGSPVETAMARVGIHWLTPPKPRRSLGVDQLRIYMDNSDSNEFPGIYVFDHCKHWLRTVPVLPRDEKKLNDIDTDCEDHMYDATRYRLNKPNNEVRTHRFG